MKKLGVITEEEMKQVNALFNEKAALCDLIISISRAAELGLELDEDKTYQRLKADMKRVVTEISEWWNRTAKRYGWKYQATDQWSFDLVTREVFLETQIT